LAPKSFLIRTLSFVIEATSQRIWEFGVQCRYTQSLWNSHPPTHPHTRMHTRKKEERGEFALWSQLCSPPFSYKYLRLLLSNE
jgi:hypothetical protein